MNNNAQAAVGHGCPQAREGRGGPRWVVKTPRQRLSTEPPGAAPTGGRAGGAHSGLRVRGAGLCAPASPFLAQWGRLTESPPGSSQAARAGDSERAAYTPSCSVTITLFSATDTPRSWSRAGSNADPGPGRRVAFRGPLLAAWLGQQACFPWDFPGDPSCRARARETWAPVPRRIESPQSCANRTERPGEQGFGSNCRRAVARPPVAWDMTSVARPGPGPPSQELRHFLPFPPRRLHAGSAE